MKIKKIPLNKDWSCEFILEPMPGYIQLNSLLEYEVQQYLISKDNGVRYSPSSRFEWTSLYAKGRCYFKCGNAMAALKQAVIEAFKPQSFKMSSVHIKFIPVKNNKTDVWSEEEMEEEI